MKTILVFNLILCQTLSIVFAQDSTDILFIESKLRDIQPDGTIYYSDRPMQDIYQQFKKSIRKKVVNHNNDTLVFSSKEIKTISNLLKTNMQTPYDDTLFRNAIKISANEIVTTVETRKQQMLDSLAQLDRSKMPKRQFLPWAFSFSRPIYFRNKEWMLFYFFYYQHSSGQHGLYLYKRTNNSWDYWGILQYGAW